jgi:diacylglycerol kinase family enzyme
MRVSLFHNSKAGDSTSLSWIRELIETSGHELVRVFDREAAFGELVDQHTELLVAAGGDGTVAAAARLLAGRTIPLAILPLGTANNIARALQGNSTSEHLVACWDIAERRRIDLGMARGHWGERRFVEAVGVGLVPASIVSTRFEPLEGDDVPSNISSAILRYIEVLSRYEPRRWRLLVDGEELIGDFLAVEVMNIRSVGPNLVLCDDADPGDGDFCLVTVGEGERDALRHYLRQRINGQDGRVVLPVRRVRHVELHGHGDTHIDDEVMRSTIPGTVSIRIEAAAVEVLVCAH